MTVLIKNTAYCLKIDKSGIYHWHFYKGELALEDYVYAYNIAKKSKNLLVLATHDKGSSFSNETWHFMTDIKTDFSFMKANAVVLNQLHLRILARFFSKIRKSTYNIKVFSNKTDALKWLLSFKNH